MSKISFDGHLIEADQFGRWAWLLNGYFQHAKATGISFDGYLMASTEAKRATHLPGNSANLHALLQRGSLNAGKAWIKGRFRAGGSRKADIYRAWLWPASFQGA